MLLNIHVTSVPPLIGLVILILSIISKKNKYKMLITGLMVTAVSFPLYMIPYLIGDYTLEEVALNTNEGMPIYLRMAASWSSSGSSILLFSSLIAFSAIPLARKKMSSVWIRVALPALIVLTITSSFLLGAYDRVEINDINNGIGLNPLLESPWIFPHPLATFIGYSLILVSSIAVLSRAVEYAKMTRLIGWGALTAGIAMGGYWSYTTLGWGGYWAWDPVETGELMVWLIVLAILHLEPVYPQYSKPFELLAVSSVMLALYITRTGLSPLHGFASVSLGSLILLGLAIIFLAFFIYNIYLLSPRALTGRPRFKLYEHYALFYAGLILCVASIIVYSSLLTPSILITIGKDVEAPSMNEGVRFYHTILAPLLILSLALYVYGFLADIIGNRKALILSISASALSIALGVILSNTGVVVAQHTPKTTIMLSLTLVILSIGATISLAYRLILDIRKHLLIRIIMKRLVHVGFTILIIGVAISGTYSFNDAYFNEVRLKPGIKVAVSDFVLELVDYRIDVQPGSVDVYTIYRDGSNQIYRVAWYSLHTLGNALASVVDSLSSYLDITERGSDAIKLPQLIISSIGESVDVKYEGNITVYMSEYASTTTFDTIKMYSGSAIVELSGIIGILPHSASRDGLGEIALIIQNSTIVVQPYIKLEPKIHTYYSIKFNPDLKLHTNKLDMVISKIDVYPTYDSINKSTIILYGSAYSTSNMTFKIPIRVNEGLYYYIMARSGYSKLLNLTLETGIHELLLSNKTINEILSPLVGDVRVPTSLPEGVTLHVLLNISGPMGSNLVNASVKYKIGGEVRGVHGLVQQVTLLDNGLGDMYMVVEPPIVRGEFDLYHELIIDYLSLISRNLSEPEKLALSSVLATGYKIDSLQSSSPERVIIPAIIDLYRLSEIHEPGSSVESQGIVVRIKNIPGVDIVWLGSAIMSVSSIIAGLMVYRRRID